MKRFLPFLSLLFAMVLALVSCAGNGKRVFGATYMTLNNPFFGVLNNGIKEVVEARGDKLMTLDPSLDQAKQVAQIEDMIDRHVAAIFLNPVDWKGVKPALEAARKAGIPVINVDAPVFDEGLVDVIVASDNYGAGELAARDMLRRLGGNREIRVVMLEHPGTKSGQDRMQGFIDAVGDNPKVRIVARRSSEGQLEQAMPVMGEVIRSQPGIDAVFCVNDPTAMGALAALEAAKRDRGVLIYGVDGAPSAKRAIKDGKMTATAVQSPLNIGRTAARAAYAILVGEETEKKILVPVTLLDGTNVDRFGLDGWE
jgi:ribose transport system substrate-binding protein